MTDANELHALAATVDEIAAKLLAISDRDASEARAPGKWSPKQVIGHLIDSAINNHVRFVLAQLQDDLVFPGYDQDAWVRVGHYGEQRWEDIVEAWRVCNQQVAAIMRTTPAAELNRPRARHNLHDIGFQPLPPGTEATLGFLMRDYVAHLHHHVRQVLGA
jgi:hypothetical protein